MFERFRLKQAQKEFYDLFCINCYILDLKKHTYENLKNLSDRGAFKNLVDKYRENCHCKNFDRDIIDKYFTNIINNTCIINNIGSNGYAIEFSQLEGSVPVISQLVYVPTKNRFISYLLEVRKPAKIDEATKLYNKDEFNSDIAKLIEQNNIDPQLAIISFDVNGLKRVNDEHSHIIGDELINGAAKCIYEAFNAFGKCYRNGKGDEFTVIVFLPESKLNKQIEYFEELLKNTKIKKVGTISISYGVASRMEFPNKSINEIYSISDERLYDNKKIYYANKEKKLK